MKIPNKIYGPCRVCGKKTKNIFIEEIKQSKNKKSDKQETTESRYVHKEKYRVGMITEMIQKEKYGRVILPYDPTFGLDPEYNAKYIDNDSGGNEEKLKLNPLFDLKNYQNLKRSASKFENVVFVGNLPNNTKTDKLEKIFSKIGKVVGINLKRKKIQRKTDNKNSIQYNVNAKISFKTPESCKEALSLNGQLYQGKHIRVTLAKDEGKPDPSKTVFVGGLSFNAQDEDLWKAFQHCGAIESVRVVRDMRTSKGVGYGYVNFKSAESVEKALTLDGKSILNREIRVRRNESNVKSLSNSLTVKRKKIMKKEKKIAPGSNTGINEIKFNTNTIANTVLESKHEKKVKTKINNKSNNNKQASNNKKFKTVPSTDKQATKCVDQLNQSNAKSSSNTDNVKKRINKLSQNVKPNINKPKFQRNKKMNKKLNKNNNKNIHKKDDQAEKNFRRVRARAQSTNIVK